MPKKTLRLGRSLLLAILIGLFPLISLWKNNLGQIPFPAVTLPFIFTLIFILIVFGICFLILRSPEKASLQSVVTSIFVFSFGHLYNLVGNSTFLGVSIGFVKLFVFCLVLYLGISFLILKSNQIPGSLFFFFNFVVAALLIINLFPIVSYFIQLNPSQSTPPPSSSVNASAQDKPDIYYIVLDAYARDDVLEQVIGYDNTEFLTALKNRGFYLPQCAYSNYSGTLMTLMSVLNMDTLDNLGVPIDSMEEYLAKNVNLILKNQAANIFRNYGYQFVTGRGYSSFNDIETSDLYLNYFNDKGINDNLDKNKFSSLYLNTTIFRVLAELYKNNPEKFSRFPFWLAVDRESNPGLAEASFWYYQNNYMFDSLAKIPEMPGKYFVYAHINAPHGPYVYRSDGSFRYPLDTQDEKVLYADTITYINKRVLALVDVLQKKSTIPPIIIFQGDHGIHVLTNGLDKHKILSAYYLPGNLSTPPYDTITPVNNFPLILTNYFDPMIKLVPDTLWVKFLNEEEPVASSCDLEP